MHKSFDHKSQVHEKNASFAGLIVSGTVLFVVLFASLVIFGVI